MNRKEHLQLMVYDDTDVTTRLKVAKKDLPEGWDPIDVNLPVGLTHSWTAGGRLYRALGRIDTFKGFKFWYKALEWLATVHPEQKIDHIQYWGHGSPGKVFMDGKSMTKDVFDGELAPLLQKIRDRLTDDALIWFRTCSTFGADRGRAFAKRWAECMGCRVAAHTHNIGLFHSGLHTLRPGQEPSWPSVEGIAEGTPVRPKKMKSSGLFKPNTINMLRNTFPESW